MPVPLLFTSGTTLSAAQTGSQTTCPLTAGTNVAVGTVLFVDAEVQKVTSISLPYSTTNPQVIRGQEGTREVAHISGAVVGVIAGTGPTASANVPPPGIGANMNVKAVFVASNASGRYRDYTTPLAIYGLTTSVGTDTAIVATTTYLIDLYITRSRVVTGVGILLGSVSTNGNGLVILYDKDGNVLNTSAIAGTTTGTAATYQQFPFINPELMLGPDQYFIGYQGSSTSDKIRTVPAAAAGVPGNTVEVTASVTGGTFGVTPNITPPTTFTATVGPVAYLY